MGNRKPTQAQRVLEYIETFGSITQHEAMIDLGIMRLASRVSELKKQGYTITGEMVKVKNRFGETCCIKRYSMEGGGDVGQS